MINQLVQRIARVLSGVVYMRITVLTLCAAFSSLWLMPQFASGADMKTIPFRPSEGPATSLETADQLMSEYRTNGKPISVRPNSGTLLHLPRAARTVFIANEEIADVQIQTATPEYIFLSGKKPGATVLYAADNKGEVLLSRLIRVEPGPTVIIHGTKVETGEPPPPPNFLVLPLQPAAAPTH